MRVNLVDGDEERELWSGYMKSEPVVSLVNEGSIEIGYLKGQTHSYWPKVTLAGKEVAVNLRYR